MTRIEANMKRVLWSLGVAAALLSAAPLESAADPLLLGGIGFGSPMNRGALINVNEASGAGAVVGPGAGPTAGVNGLTFDSFGALFGTTISNPVFDPGAGLPMLVRLDPATGTSLLSLPLIFGGNPLEVNDLAADPATGMLYGVSVNTASLISSLYTIDKATGVATLLGPTGVIGVTLAFGPTGTLFMTSATFDMMGTQTGSFLNTVNPATGALLSTIAISALPSGNLVHIGGLAVRPTDGTIFASGREATVSQRGEIYILSPTGSATLVGSTGVGEVGDLAFTPIPEPMTILLISTGLAVRRVRNRFWQSRVNKHRGCVI